MGLVDDNEVVVSPVDPVEAQTQRLTTSARQVSVRQNVVVEPVAREDVGREVGVVVGPVLGQLLWCEDENGLVPKLVVLDHRQGRERFAEPYAVGEDAAAVGLQLVDDPDRGVSLEVVEALPDLGVLIARPVVWQHVLADVLEELAEEVVEDQEVDPRW